MRGLVFPLRIVVVNLLAALFCSLSVERYAALSLDGLALLAFKSAVTDDPTSALGDWVETDADPCRWSGVTCANVSAAGSPPTALRVVGLAVAAKNVSGYIPSEFGSLLFLRRLNLHGNRLSGPVPVSLANASSLHSLFLYDNSFNGSFPSSLCNIPRLQNLDLSRNSLSGELPLDLRNCRQLQRLLLDNNNFSGQIPAGIWSEMGGMLQLDLSANRFAGPIPPDMGSLGSLTGTLNLSKNLFTGRIPEGLGKLPATVSLDLQFNNLSGEIPSVGTLGSQGPTAFLHNPLLCGFPLQNPCLDLTAPPPVPSTASPSSQSNSPSLEQKGLRSWLIIVISVADAAGVALIGVIAVYIYWKFRDNGCSWKGQSPSAGRKSRCVCCGGKKDDGDDEDDDDEEEEVEDGKGKTGEGRLVAIDKKFQVELDELLRSSAYVLGKGGKGIVYKVVVGNGVPVAVRRIGGGTGSDGGGRGGRYKDFAAEAAAVGRVRHGNVVRMRAYYWSPDEKLLITDLVSNGNLATALRGRSGQPILSWANRLRIAKGAARGLAHIHEFSPQKLVHGDIKPTNILVDDQYNAFIADLGLNRLISIAGCSESPLISGPSPKTALAERPNYYRAPEARFPASRPAQKWDVYSFGVVLLEMLTGRPPETSTSTSLVSESSARHTPELVRWVRKCFDDARPWSEIVDPAIIHEAHAKKDVVAVLHVALQCTEADPEQRPRMKTVSNHLDRIAGSS